MDLLSEVRGWNQLSHWTEFSLMRHIRLAYDSPNWISFSPRWAAPFPASLAVRCGHHQVLVNGCEQKYCMTLPGLPLRHPARFPMLPLFPVDWPGARSLREPQGKVTEWKESESLKIAWSKVPSFSLTNPHWTMTCMKQCTFIMLIHWDSGIAYYHNWLSWHMCISGYLSGWYI